MILIQKEKNRLRKEINRFLGKGMSNIYLKVAIETFWKPRFSGLKEFVSFSIILILKRVMTF